MRVRVRIRVRVMVKVRIRIRVIVWGRVRVRVSVPSTLAQVDPVDDAVIGSAARRSCVASLLQ